MLVIHCRMYRIRSKLVGRTEKVTNATVEYGDSDKLSLSPPEENVAQADKSSVVAEGKVEKPESVDTDSSDSEDSDESADSSDTGKTDQDTDSIKSEDESSDSSASNTDDDEDDVKQSASESSKISLSVQAAGSTDEDDSDDESEPHEQDSLLPTEEDDESEDDSESTGDRLSTSKFVGNFQADNDQKISADSVAGVSSHDEVDKPKEKDTDSSISLESDTVQQAFGSISEAEKGTDVQAEIHGIVEPRNEEESTTAFSPSMDSAEEVQIDLDQIATLRDDKTDIIVSAVTWNLAEESPSEEDATFIRRFRKAGHDLVLISGQECENIKPRRSEGSRSREFRRLMIKMLGKDYVPLALHLLGGIQFGLFCKRSILADIEQASIADVTCGIGNVFHNKGAIGCFVQMKARETPKQDVTTRRSKSIRMLFVTAHMAAHVKNAEARDSDFWRIASELEAQAPPRFLPARKATEEGTGSYLLESVDRIFFCGDLNYRIDLPREEVENSVSQIKKILESNNEKKEGNGGKGSTRIAAIRSASGLYCRTACFSWLCGR